LVTWLVFHDNFYLKYIFNFAGYKTKNQFWDGSPCEFGHVSFHTCNEVAHERERLNQNIDRDFVTSLGLLTSFGWTVAQAYNQGINQ
jgi:hypothetical protein